MVLVVTATAFPVLTRVTEGVKLAGISVACGRHTLWVDRRAPVTIYITTKHCYLWAEFVDLLVGVERECAHH